MKTRYIQTWRERESAEYAWRNTRTIDAVQEWVHRDGREFGDCKVVAMKTANDGGKRNDD